MRMLAQRWGASVFMALSLWMAAPSAQAHLFRWESRQGTHVALMSLFPAADPHRFRVKHHRFDDAEVRALQARGLELPSSQRDATFYIAYDDRDQLVGVAVFLVARVGAEAASDPLRLGIAVDGSGRIHRIEVLDVDGKVRVGRAFLEQLEGRDLADSFDVDGIQLRAAEGRVDDCQRVAHAGREAMVLMQVALGRSG